ncbi:MAG TPA: DUF456 domain-containing protein [Pirellulales bacterium]
MIYLALALLLSALLAGWLLTLFSMPGNWLAVAALALFAGLVPDADRWGLGWPVVIAALIVALVGELAELAAGAMGAARHGGSKRGAVLAVLGSMIGAVLGASLGVPIPVVGPIVGVVLGAGLGAFCGAVLGEFWKGRSAGHAWQVGQGAFWGRLAGSLAKIASSTIILVLGLAAVASSFF